MNEDDLFEESELHEHLQDDGMMDFEWIEELRLIQEQCERNSAQARRYRKTIGLKTISKKRPSVVVFFVESMTNGEQK